ncbi:hypothetical protein KUCAC02_033313 [Chaenocephalus aceratus]|nr:hypothetical protein KUCAC02_033313 [Chaenocephalus aceratus]
MDLLQVWGFFGLVCFIAAPDPSYLLLVPRSLRPGVATTLSVSLLTRSSSVNVSALIRHKELILSSNSTIVSGGSTQLLTLPPIPESESSHWSTYQLETDRSSYLPGQVVKIRAVSVLPDGKPLQRPLNITINDPRGNLLRQWLDVEGVLGVVSTESSSLKTLLWGNGASSPPST